MLPLSVFAAETNPISTTEPIIDAPEATDDTHVIAELSEKRTEYTKEFRLSNGLHMAVVYANPVHYEKDGQWAEIDNTLKTSGTGTDAVLTNTAGVWDVRFPQQLSDTNAVTITKDGYTLSFFMSGQLRSSIGGGHVFTEEMGSLDTFSTGDETYEVHAASTVTAQVQEIDLTEAKAQAKHPETVIDKNYSRVSYTDLYANTDVVYDLVSNNVKESIIIDAYDPSVQGYRYTLNVGNMVPVLTDSNEILLYDENQENVIMVMPAPYLEDAAGEYCDDVAITLFGKGETWILAYTLPQEWMADESRSYPIILDPMVTADSSGSNIEDLSVYEWDPEDYTENRLDVGRNAKHGTMRAFIKFLNLPTLGTGDVVVDATLTLYHFALGYIVTPITVHKVKQDWTETTMTWANQPEHDIHASDYNAPEAAGDFYWDVTEIVRSWYEEGNRGLMLRVSDAREAYNTAYSSQHQFYSKASKYHPPIRKWT